MKTRSTSIREKLTFQFFCIFILTALVVSHTAGSAMAKSSIDLSKEEGTIAEQKSRAEGKVGILNTAYKNKQISRHKYTEGINLYNEAKAAYDRWITELQSKIRSGGKLNVLEYDADIGKAVQKADLFNNQVDEWLHLKPKGIIPVGGPDYVAALVSALADAALKIFERSKEADHQEREDLIKELDHLKWKPFDQVL